MTLKINGKDYPVTAKFQKDVLDVHPHLAEMPYSDLKDEQRRLLRLSNARADYSKPIPEGEETAPGGTLTVKEMALLQNITHITNCHDTQRFLGGRLHSEFGFTGVDQVHGIKETHSCGCVTQHIIDHYKGREWVEGNEPLQHFPHFSRHACTKHKLFMLDYKNHAAAIHAETIE
jgi:hypothetical protein